MRAIAFIVVLLPVLTCCTASRDMVRRGTPITHVQADFGLPDVISDSSGSDRRFYTPENRPKYEWPWDAPRTFYYLDRNLVVIFQRGKTVRSEKLKPSIREAILEPLIRENATAE